MDLLEKRKSKIHGFGVFATRRIPKGEKFYKILPDKIHTKTSPGHACIGEGKWVSDKILSWVNHSRSPNTILDTKNLVLIAKRDIPKDDEITCDYRFTEPLSEDLRKFV